MKDQCQHLTEDQRKYLINLFKNCEELSAGTLGTWKTDPVDFGL